MNVWIEAFIVIAAVAIVVQMAILLGMYLQMKGAIDKFTVIADELKDASTDTLRTNRILEDSGRQNPRASWAMALRSLEWRAGKRRRSTACSRIALSGCGCK